MQGATILSQPDWYGALTLQERIALRRAHGSRDSVPDFDAALAAWRWEEWKRQRPFEDVELFSERIARSGTDVQGFRSLLGISAATLRDWCADDTPGWLLSLQRVLSSERTPLPNVVPPGSSRSMLEIFSPFITDGLARLSNLAASIANGCDHPPFTSGSVHLLLCGSLLNRILTAVSRVLTLELHIARIQGVLAGETPEERFASFVERFRQPEHLNNMLREYPVLARMLMCQTDQWVETSAELLRRLTEDQAALSRELNGGNPLGHLTRVSNSGVGDLHCGGRSVAILDFSSGLRLVYKPRSLAVDRAFYNVVEWLNRVGGCPPLRILKTLDRGSHGWVEFAHAESCGSPEEVERYYERLGGLLALLYAIDGQDMHMENIVAAGEQPVLVDLETLFHPLRDELLLLDAPGETGLISADPLRPEPFEIAARSVLKVAMLPQRVWGEEEEGGGIDLSGIGGVGNQISPTFAPRLENAGSDEMRFTRAQVSLQAASNQPQMTGAGIPPAAYADAVDRGFTGVYRSLAARGSDLKAGGLIAAFGDIPLRVVMRMTRTYGSLQRESFHPDFLRDAVDMDRFLDQLWLGAETRGGLKPLIPSEQEALHRGDIPVFFAVANSRDLVSDTGLVIPEYFRRSGMVRVWERIESMSPQDMERQRLLIRGSMATLIENPLVPQKETQDAHSDVRVRVSAGRPDSAAHAPEPEELIRLAEEVGERLQSLAVRGSRLASWINLTTHDGIHSVSGLTRYDLHGGIPGILIFLAYLDQEAGTDRHEGLARSAFATLNEFLHHGKVLLRDLGGFTGLGGILPALAVAEVRWPDLHARILAERVIERIDAVQGEQRRFDLFGGVSGAVAGLLAYHQATGMDMALEAAIRCGDQVLAQGSDFLFCGTDQSTPSGTSYAFGSAGVAWSLLRLYQATGNERFRASATEALEHAWQRWEAQPRSSTQDGTWCYGAPGILLALAAAREVGRGPSAALERAVDVTLRVGLEQSSDALCNGRLGALDALLEVAPLLPGAETLSRIRGETRLLLDSVRRRGWRCGVPLALEVPGLMNGLAGMGYGLLRLARPHLVPSMLTLGVRSPCAKPDTVPAHRAPALDAC